MENKEYYTPTIEELFIGYELEFRIKPDPIKGVTWTKYTIHKGDNIWDYELRTPYLCKQDIIDLGFIYNGRNKFYTDIEDFQFNTVDKEGAYLNYFLQFGDKDHYIQIEEMGSDTLFQGTCKSKNELYKLMKDYLNIPI